MKLIYPAIFIPDRKGEGYTVEVPDLPGCVTEGDTLAEAIEMGIDAASGWILSELEEGNDFPAPSKQQEIVVKRKGAFVNLLLLDIDAYAEKYGNKAVRKNITIPAWLNTYGEKNHLNFSKVLSDALLARAVMGKQIIMHNGLPFPATLQQPVPARDNMTEEEFNMMMATGYKQAVEDISYPAEDVFEELKK